MNTVIEFINYHWFVPNWKLIKLSLHIGGCVTWVAVYMVVIFMWWVFMGYDLLLNWCTVFWLYRSTKLEFTLPLIFWGEICPSSTSSTPFSFTRLIFDTSLTSFGKYLPWFPFSLQCYQELFSSTFKRIIFLNNYPFIWTYILLWFCIYLVVSTLSQFWRGIPLLCIFIFKVILLIL